MHVARRHLSHVQKRFLIAQHLKDAPNLSDRQIASIFGVSPTTVGSVRHELEATGQLSKLDSRLGADGKVRQVGVAISDEAKNFVLLWLGFNIELNPPSDVFAINPEDKARTVDIQTRLERLKPLAEES